MASARAQAARSTEPHVNEWHAEFGVRPDALELPCRLPYNPRWLPIVLGSIAFGGASAFFAFQALFGRGKLNLEGIITLGPAMTRVFYGVFAVLSALFVVVALLAVVRRIASPRVLELGTDAVILPEGLFQMRTARLAYSDIERIEEREIERQKFLHVFAGGKRHSVIAALLPDAATYAAVKDLISARVALAEHST
jgi:hypothetical protein